MKSKINIISIILLVGLFFIGIKVSLASTLHDTYKKGNPAIFSFSSRMCHDCKKLKKTFSHVYPDYKDKINFTFIDASRMSKKEREMAKKHRVNVVPTLIFIDENNQFIRKTEGSMSEAQLRKYMEELTK